MHGKRKKDVKPLSEEERQKNEEQGVKIINLLNEFLKIRQGELPVKNPSEYCDLTASMCPDLPTIYNFKREVVTSTLSETPNLEDKYKLLMNELLLVTGLLKRSPKSYSLWSYRQWLVLECRHVERLCHEKAAQKQKEEDDQVDMKNQGKEAEKQDAHIHQQKQKESIPRVVEMELKLCNKMLDLDERNFHCWNYRNWLISEVEKSSMEYVERELAYTLAKYEKNFSNFSALHFRSKNLVKKYKYTLENSSQEQEQNELVEFTLPLERLKEELQLIKNAIFIQPNEEGVWQYHKWLCSLLIPFRFISARKISNPNEANQSLVSSNETCEIELCCSEKIQSEHLSGLMSLLDSKGEVLNEFKVEPSSGVAQTFILKSKSPVGEIRINQCSEPRKQVLEYQMVRRNLRQSIFRWDSLSKKFIICDEGENDKKFRDIAYTLLQEETEFVNEVIQNEDNGKFAYFHLLFLIRVKQQLDLVFDTNNHSLAIESTKAIIDIIQKVMHFAKKQTFYLKNLHSQYSDLLQLQKSLVEQPSTPFHMPISPSYEIDLLIPYHSLISL